MGLPAVPPPDRWFRWYLASYAVLGASTLGFFPSFSHNNGDEGTYFSFALRPWTLISDLFEGFPPKEVMNPYAPRLFLTPFALTFSLFGFTVVGGRLWVFAYGIALLFLLHRTMRSFASPGTALGVTVLLSLSPTFVYFSHAVRPEGLMTLLITVCLWLLLRKTDPLDRPTCLALGALSAAAALVHYNGVIVPMAVILGMACHELPRMAWWKAGWFAAGGTAVFAVFLVVDFIPAFDTVQRFGILPVTFVSTGRVSFLHESAPKMVTDFVRRSMNGFMAGTYYEDQSVHVTFTVAMFASLAFLWITRREVRCAAAVLVGLIAGLIAVVPNKRTEYLFYLYPSMLILATAAFERLPRRSVKIGAAVMLVAAGGVYACESATTVRWHYTHARANARTYDYIRAVVREVGPESSVKVMGTQAFLPAVPTARYRTVHSLIELKDIDEMLRRIAPDVFIVDSRVVTLVQVFIPEDRRPPSPERDTFLRAALERHRFEPAGHGALTWNGEAVTVYVKRPPGVRPPA